MSSCHLALNVESVAFSGAAIYDNRRLALPVALRRSRACQTPLMSLDLGMSDGRRGFELRLEYQICNVVSFLCEAMFGSLGSEMDGGPVHARRTSTLALSDLVNILLLSGGLEDGLLDKSFERWVDLFLRHTRDDAALDGGAVAKLGCGWRLGAAVRTETKSSIGI
ncbi:hypothetical protein CASFOL_022813 [Castilleja foliolosa]|uniref:Uncharacterized protein n=1 Tax=Castilleja foliolosa TaxID=1961234 RepID=A0ABD3CVE9_9LAMI